MEELLKQYNTKKEIAKKLYGQTMDSLLKDDYINPESIIKLNEAYEERLQNIDEWFIHEVSKLSK